MSTALISRALLALRAGLQFGGKRDLYEVYGYRLQLNFNDHFAKYCRQDIASRIVDAPAQATWRNAPEIIGANGFDTKWTDLVKKQKLWHYLERVDRLAGIGRYSVMLVGFDDGAPLDTPVGTAQEVIFLQPFSEPSAAIRTFEPDSNNPRFNMPQMYELNMVDPSSTIDPGILARSTVAKSNRIDVHHSRILHVAESVLEDNILGIPRLSKVFNLLEDLAKIVGGSAETFWLTASRGIQADIDKDMDLSTDDAKALSDEIEEWHHQLRRFVKTRGVKMNVLGSDVPNPSGPFDVIISLISGSTGIPRRILLGSEAGQLASEQDRANWAERIDERRGSFAQPIILEPFIDLLNKAGVLPQPADEVEFEWPSAYHLSPLEKAMTSAQSARSVANLSKQGTKTAPMLITTVEEAREIVGLPAEGAPEQPTFEEETPGQEEIDIDDPDVKEELDDAAADQPE